MIDRRGAATFLERLEQRVFYPLTNTSWVFWGFVGLLAAAVAWGLYAYATQLQWGLVTTGMNNTVPYGLYIVNFVFFIGISYAGALVSAILRLTNAGWRSPITRIAELIAVGGLTDGAIQPIIDLGRPDRLLNIVQYGRFQSPLLWDMIAILTYLAGSFIYLYLPLIPDLALARDRLGSRASTLKRKFYEIFSIGWQDTPEQRRRLNKAIGIMAVLIIPLAISVHTVVAFIFSVNLRPGWNSTIYGIYFVIAAVFSGTAVLLIMLAVFRRTFRLQEFITQKHFRYLGLILLVMLATYLYLTFTEYLTVGYKLETEEFKLLQIVLQGDSAAWFWFFVIGGMIVPGFLLIISKKRPIAMVVTAAVLVVIGMWVKRYIIVVPSLQVPLMPFEFGTYAPTWVEISIGIATLAGFVLMITLATRVFPLISVWEMKEEEERQEPEAAAAGGKK